MKIRAPNSLFGQLVLSQALLMTGVAILLPLLLMFLLNKTADNFIAARLTRDAKIVAAHMPTGPIPAAAAALPTALLFHERNQGRRFAVIDADGSVLLTGPSGLPQPFASTPHGTGPVYSKRGRFDILTLPVLTAKQRPRWIVVAQDRTVPVEIVDDVVRTFLTRFIWIVPATLILSLLIGLLLVRRVTGNLRHAAARADSISLERFDVRFDPTSLPREASPLANATNRALDRLEAGYRFQGEFIGNVAHELRTPLALISLRTEGLDPSADRDLIQLGVERANHVIRQLMELASIDRHLPKITQFDPGILAVDVAAMMAPLVFKSDHVLGFIEPEGRPLQVRGIPGLVEIALTNLIDNAVRHTPAGCTVTVSIESDGAIIVDDDGPGIAIDDQDARSRRYRRAGTNRSDSAGIGLAIVERIMSTCGGTLETMDGPAGGARFVMRLPLAPYHVQS